MSSVAARPYVFREVIAGRSGTPWQRHLAIGLRIGDFCVVALSGIATHHVRFDGVAFSFPQWLALALGIVLAMLCLSIAGCYREKSIDHLTSQLAHAVLAWSAAMGSTLAVLYLVKQIEPVSRIWSVSWFVVGLVGLVALRGLGRHWVARSREHGAFLRHLAIVRESGQPLERILDGIAMDPSLEPWVEIEIDPRSPEQVTTAIDELRTLRGIDQVVLALNPAHTEALSRLVGALRLMPMEVNLLAGPIGGELPTIGVRSVGSLPATVLVERPLDQPFSVLKEVMDRVLSALALVFLAPLLLLIALAIKLDSRGPVLFRQLRHGFDCQPIEVLKFRTMRIDACDQPAASAVVQATRDDERVTRVGRFLRRSSLDELPQLLNVLRGDMSLVGPRPHAIAHDQHYAALIDGYLGRHRVKPGITGWAQINGCRGETRTVEEMRRRIELDLYYIDNWSLSLDLKILLRTPVVGFVNENAY